MDRLQSCRRINVVGSSGSGKSTFARQLAEFMGTPYVELDALHWGPDWYESPDEEFFPKIEQALSPDAWVLDGNYHRTLPIKWRRVEAVIWLDLPYWQIFWQVLSRTLKRTLTGEELWSGNRESLRMAFLSRDSVIWWSLTNLGNNRRRYEALMSDGDYSHINFVRLRSRREVRSFLERLDEPV